MASVQALTKAEPDAEAELVIHDHVSVPVDMETGKAAMDLKPKRS